MNGPLAVSQHLDQKTISSALYHIFDFGSTMINSDKIVFIRLLATLSRFFSIIPSFSEQGIKSRDIAFQLFTLMLSSQLLLKSLLPIFRTIINPKTHPELNPFYLQDMDAYNVLFKSLDLSML